MNDDLFLVPAETRYFWSSQGRSPFIIFFRGHLRNTESGHGHVKDSRLKPVSPLVWRTERVLDQGKDKLDH